LEGVNEERKAKLEEVQAENVILKAEVSQLVNVIKDSPALSSLLLNVTSWVCLPFFFLFLFLFFFFFFYLWCFTCFLLTFILQMVLYTLREAVKAQNVQQTVIPAIIQQKLQQFPHATRAIC
jgi:hypothetical protein